MSRGMKSIVAGTAFALTVAFAASAWAGPDAITIGVMSDQSGPFSDINGLGDVLAAQMAIDEFGGTVIGKPIKLLKADPQNKTDVGLAIAKRWIEEDHVDLLADLPSSGLAIALQGILKTEPNGIVMNAGPNAAVITGSACSPYGFQWSTDSYAGAHATRQAMQNEGVKDWFFVQIDWASGLSAANDLKAILEEGGQKVIGAVKTPVGTTDYSSYLLQAQSSKAQAVALILSGADLVNAAKQAHEFGLVKGGQKLTASLSYYVTDAVSMGLDVAQGLMAISGYPWNENPEAEAWSRKFFAQYHKMPNDVQIAQYSQVRHYLEAVKAAGTDNRDAVAAKIRELPVNDAFVKNGVVRADGRMVHDLYLIVTKSPAESKEQWDVFKLLHAIPGNEVFRPLDKGGCPLVKS